MVALRTKQQADNNYYRGEMMDSYIVRIYRRSQDDPGELAGLVEMVGTSERLSFRDFPELTYVLRRMLKQGEEGAVVTLQQTGATSKSRRAGRILAAGLKG
jgi:hypothetical protein